MKIFIINLEERSDRRQAVQHALGSAGVEFEFFRAINGEQALANWFSGIDNWACLLETGHFATHGELGCYASHLSLWKTCIDLNEPIVIMEDDFAVTGDFAATLGRASRIVDRFGFLRLEPIEQRWGRKKDLAPVILEEESDWRLLYQRMPSVRLTCYAIAPACARALIAMSDIFTCPVDHMVRRCWAHKQSILALEPAAVNLSRHAEHSSIGNRKKVFIRHFIGPMRAVYRVMERQRARRHAVRRLEEIQPKLRTPAIVD